MRHVERVSLPPPPSSSSLLPSLPSSLQRTGFSWWCGWGSRCHMTSSLRCLELRLQLRSIPTWSVDTLSLSLSHCLVLTWSVDTLSHCLVLTWSVDTLSHCLVLTWSVDTLSVSHCLVLTWSVDTLSVSSAIDAVTLTTPFHFSSRLCQLWTTHCLSESEPFAVASRQQDSYR